MKLRDIFTADYSSRTLQRLSVLVIVVVTVAVYYPSLFHAARSDQIVYLADVADKHDLGTIVADTYSLDRSREFFLGEDHLLFRPVLYTLLGLEKWLFGYDFFLWQLTSLLLHLCAVWLLLKILYDEGKNILAPLFALFFAVQFVSMDMVIWHHLSGYLLFSVFLLAALYNLRRYAEHGKPGSGVLLAAFLLLAAFTYELGSAAAVLVALYMLFERKRSGFSWKAIAAAIMVPAVYVAASALDLYARFGDLSVLVQVSSAGLPSALIKAAGASIFWFASGLDPALIHMTVYERLSLSITDISSRWEIMAVIPACIVLGSILFLSREALAGERLRRKAGYVALVLLLMAAHSLIIVIGRADELGFWPTMSLNPYYAYVSNLLAVIAIYVALGTGAPGHSRWAVPRAGLALSLLLITAMSAASIREVNMRMLDYTGPRSSFVKEVSALVQAHSAEEGFSFSVSGDCTGIDILNTAERVGVGGFTLREGRGGNDILWLTRSGDPPGKTYTLAEALFPGQYVESGGKYEISCKPRRRRIRHH